MIVAHRRSGKTTATLNHLIRDALRTKDSKYAFICPTYKQAKNVAWDILKGTCEPIEGAKFNESELRVDFQNKSRITLYGADNPDSLRGIALWGVVFDEYSQQPSNIFSEIIRPALSDHKGYAIWIGTPKGKNEFHKLYNDHKNDKKWETIILRASESGLIDHEELLEAKATMTEDEYNQEFECSFLAGIKGAYYSSEISQMRQDERITKVPYDAAVPVHTAWDLGMSDATSIIFFQVIRGRIQVIDHYKNSDETLAHYIKEIQNKPYVYGNHWLPWDARARDLATGLSLLEQARKLGLKAQITPNIGVNDGINIVKTTLSRMWIDEKLESFIDSVSQYRRIWDEKRGEYRNKPLHDWTSHDADALRYVCIVADKVVIRQEKKREQSGDSYKSILGTHKKVKPKIRLSW